MANSHGSRTSLIDLLARGPAVLAFYRGGWCRYCNLQLRAYQRILPEIKACGATLVATSLELPDNSLSTAEENTLRFPVLSDVGNSVAAAFGLVMLYPRNCAQHCGRTARRFPRLTVTKVAASGASHFHRGYRSPCGVLICRGRLSPAPCNRRFVDRASYHGFSAGNSVTWLERSRMVVPA